MGQNRHFCARKIKLLKYAALYNGLAHSHGSSKSKNNASDVAWVGIPTFAERFLREIWPKMAQIEQNQAKIDPNRAKIDELSETVFP